MRSTALLLLCLSPEGLAIGFSVLFVLRLFADDRARARRGPAPPPD